MVLHLLEYHSACTRLTRLYCLPQQFLQPPWQLRPPSSTMYSSVYFQTPPTLHFGRHSVLDHTLTLSRFILQALALTLENGPLLSGLAVPSYGPRESPSLTGPRGDLRHCLGEGLRLLVRLSPFRPSLPALKSLPRRPLETSPLSRLLRRQHRRRQAPPVSAPAGTRANRQYRRQQVSLVSAPVRTRAN